MLCEIYVQNLKEWYYLKITFRIFFQHSQPPMLQKIMNVIADSSTIKIHTDIYFFDFVDLAKHFQAPRI